METKPALQSKTIIAWILTTVNGVVMLLVSLGYLDDAVWKDIMTNLPQIIDVLLMVFGTVSTLWGLGSIYWRVKADTKIDSL